MASAGGGLEPFTIKTDVSTDQNNPTMLTKNTRYVVTHPTHNSGAYYSIAAHGNHIAGDYYEFWTFLNYAVTVIFPDHSNGGASGTQRLHLNRNRYNTTNNSQFAYQNKRAVIICTDITDGVEHWVDCPQA